MAKLVTFTLNLSGNASLYCSPPAGSSSVKQSDTVVGPEERLNFTVTRHTPRRYPPRRTLSVSDDSPQNVGKKMKLESEENSSTRRNPVAMGGGQSKTAGKND